VLSSGENEGVSLAVREEKVNDRAYRYTFTTGDAAADATLRAYFRLGYAPYAMEDAAWAGGASFATPRSTAPQWVIRNGLNDAEQTPAVYDAAGNVTDYGTNFERYTSTGLAGDGILVNANGAISVSVVPALE
jgi:hypothetical protein